MISKKVFNGKSTGEKALSNSFSTGGGGPHFENHISAMFVLLMLAGGHTPGLPCWPIVEIRLQTKKVIIIQIMVRPKTWTVKSGLVAAGRSLLHVGPYYKKNMFV